jgi:hypothetical protein
MSAAGTQDRNVDGDRRDNLTDDDLESEIELVSELVLAATSSDRPLRQDEVDLLLGIVRNKGAVSEESAGAESDG